ncbi:hypothetical protein V8C43DRAFT_271240 [Trichoderma afarasin]
MLMCSARMAQACWLLMAECCAFARIVDHLQAPRQSACSRSVLPPCGCSTRDKLERAPVKRRDEGEICVAASPSRNLQQRGQWNIRRLFCPPPCLMGHWYYRSGRRYLN